MQALLERLASDLTGALTTAIVVRGSTTPCPDCVCSPALSCPPLECRCPSGEGHFAASRPDGWSTELVVLGLVLAFGYGVLVGARVFGKGAFAAPAGEPQRPAGASEPTVTLDLATAAAAQARSFRR